jgi:hypothetical protein
MKQLAIAALVLVSAVGSVGIETAAAQDHMKCYKIKDPLKLKGIVDIDTPQFGPERGCKIGKSVFFCVPGEKTVVEAVDASTDPPTPITPLSITNGAQPGDQICYQVRCPQPFPPDQDVTDQFGRRRITKLIPSLLCTPAIKGDPPTVPCADSAPLCNGPCPTGLSCVALSPTAGCECRPVAPCGGTFPQCNGICPASQPKCIPVGATVGGVPQDCRCVP